LPTGTRARFLMVLSACASGDRQSDHPAELWRSQAGNV
jgi:hypothetical protein